ncbi:ankyrin [Aspergillus eucalypticola CBS 122712]|uniref:Ankyrin n=1 Tax=Aspergillus eucalypticola (strain CBS 122712 / IBT 29274) TaxID=1448314 RepID=A0A317WJC4_ASPEC|nr:ankyrin [Aspergillus eucalypticola CBS 122712]PWY84320.1 ankyrin [Aspergillus eucalypticola CBS 122712]
MSQQGNPIIPHCIFCNQGHPEPAGDAIYEHIEQHLDDLNRRFREKRADNEENSTIIDCEEWPGCRHRPLTSIEGDAHAIHWAFVDVARFKRQDPDEEHTSCDLCGTRHATLAREDLENHIRDFHNLLFNNPMVAHPSPSELSELPPSPTTGSEPMEFDAAEEAQEGESETDDVETEEVRAQGSREEAAAEAQYDSEEEEPKDLPHDLRPVIRSLEQALSDNIMTIKNFLQVICDICRDHRFPIEHLPQLEIHNALRVRLAPLVHELYYIPGVSNNLRVTPQHIVWRFSVTTIGEALRAKKVRPIRVLCDLGFRINDIMESNITVLGAAILLRHNKLAQYLLNPEFKERYGVDPFARVTTDNRYSNGITPIALCVWRGEYNTLRTILSYETPPYVMRTEEVNGLFRSQKWEHIKKALRDPCFGGAIFAPRYPPISPIHSAVVNRDTEVLQRLVRPGRRRGRRMPNLSAYINSESSTIVQDSTPLLLAMHYLNEQAVNELLASPYIDLSKQTSRMVTPLYYAARIVNIKLVQVLMDHSADPTQVTGLGTPIHALVHTYKDAKAAEEDWRNPPAFETLKQRIGELLHLFLDKGVDPNVRAAAGTQGPRTAIEEARSVGFLEFLEVIEARRTAAAAAAGAAS